MAPTEFQSYWMRVADRWGLRVECPFVVRIGGIEVPFPVLLRDFGGEQGMLLTTDWADFKDHHEALYAAGYGMSCLSDRRDHPKEAHPSEADPEEEEALMDMLADWGWSGSGDTPSWYRPQAG